MSASFAQVLVAREEIETGVSRLGREIAETYRGVPGEVVLVGVLKGSAVFLADLARAIPLDLTIDFISISSYGADASGSGVVRIVKDLEQDISGKHVVVVEDIVDTGLTLTYLRKTLGARSPATLRTVTLIDKAARRLLPVPVEWRGFEAPDAFLLGYGLDYRGIYRNVPDLIAVPDVARLALHPRSLVEELYPSQ
jgi:hypoxanthine phosphoribosyltransferase